MKDLVADARSGDQFYLHCQSLAHTNILYVTSCFMFFLVSGHGSQLPDDNGDEEDGSDECMSILYSLLIADWLSLIGILTCDHEIILDDVGLIPHLFLTSLLIYTVDFESTSRGSPPCGKYLRGAYLWISSTLYLSPHQTCVYSPLSIRVIQEPCWVSLVRQILNCKPEILCIYARLDALPL